MYLYKNLRTNIISQKDEDDEEAIDLQKDLKIWFLEELRFTDKIVGLFKSIQKQRVKRLKTVKIGHFTIFPMYFL